MVDDHLERVTAVVKAELDGFTMDCGEYSTFANTFTPDLARYIAQAAIEAMQGCQQEREKMLVDALNPRLWSKEMHDAWHRNIPDIQKAFEAIRKQALAKLEKE